MSPKVWLIGTGIMSAEYLKVLKAQNVDFQVIGRSESSSRKFEMENCVSVVSGGLSEFLKTSPQVPTHAIVSVGVEDLAAVSLALINYGVKGVLVEKPAGLSLEEIDSVCCAEKENKAFVYVAYNRRFYSSVIKAEEIIKEDGGVSSFTFEFTELSHIVSNLENPRDVKERWFLANSTHVVDLAFYLGGKPEDLSCYTSGSSDWHPSATVFAGAGRSVRGALFSYRANWEAPGRWGVEILTHKHRLIFSPMERLQVQKIKSFDIDFVELDDGLDKSFKPGIFRQVDDFLNSKKDRFCSIEEQSNFFPYYQKMANY